jgi:sirohydrochlorin ferrochelatase
MQGVLYVCHGSRIPEALSENTSFIQSVMKGIDVPLQELCFLELAVPDILQGIDRLAANGATKIAVIPVLLLHGGHYYNDIPEKMNVAQEKYPQISFSYGEPIGVQNRIVDILIDRMTEPGIPVHKDAKILVIGRGSKYPQTKFDIESIGQKLKEKTGFQFVETCFLAGNEPLFDQVFQDSLNDRHSQLILVPYLWFTGYLMNYLHKKVNEIKGNKKKLILCHQLGEHPTMVEALTERVYESL